MADVVLTNSLMLSDEECETIASLSAINYTMRQMAMYLEIPFAKFQKASIEPDNKIKYYIEKGKLESDFRINDKIRQDAEGGNQMAKMIFDKTRELNEIEQIKSRTLYGED